MNDQQNHDNILRPLEAFVVIAGSILLTLFIIGIVGAFFALKDPQSLEQSSTQIILIILGELGLGSLPLFYLYKKKYPLKTLYRLNIPEIKILLLIIPVSFSLTIVSDEIDRLVSLFFTPPEELQHIFDLFKSATSFDLFLLILGTAIVAPVAEEASYRGFLQISMERHYNVTSAVVYSSLFFAITHFLLVWTIQIFLIGIILGYLAWRTRSLLPSIICHGINNAFALFTIKQGDAIAVYYEWGGHISPLFLIPAIAVLVLGIRFLDNYYSEKSTDASIN
jgi:membrane protease YdiL (CAAX protease family)